MNREDLKTAVCFDLDSCLAWTRNRWHLSPSADPASDWHKYCAARMGDAPIAGTVRAAELHYPHHQVHIISGSSDSSRAVTLAWLDLHHIPFDSLKQRPAGDETANGMLKVRFIRELNVQGIDVVLFYEDHPRTAEEIGLAGVPVLGVNPFYPEDAHKFQQGAFDNRGGGL